MPDSPAGLTEPSAHLDGAAILAIRTILRDAPDAN
jgi:hypothetical protein